MVALVHRVVGGDKLDAWRALLTRVAPRIETWARGNRLLQRCRLAGDDDARTVMVSVLERLAADDHANLRLFVARGELSPPPADLVADVIRLGKLELEPEPTEELDVGTPFRAWLLRLVDFTARDHVRKRLGWGARVGSKRDLHSDALPLDRAREPSARPPMTDRLTVAQLVQEVLEHLATLPAQMREALALWLDDVEPHEIATRLALADVARAKALIRAGQARLRDHFRGRSPVLFA